MTPAARPAAGNFAPAPEKAPLGATVLVLDDEALMRWSLRERLSRLGLTVLEAETGAEALALARSRRIDLILLDLELPDMNGIAVLTRLRAERNPCPVILMTAYGTPEVAEKAVSFGARRCIAKPFDLDAMAGIVETELALS